MGGNGRIPEITGLLAIARTLPTATENTVRVVVIVRAVDAVGIALTACFISVTVSLPTSIIFYHINFYHHQALTV